jgi:hypothetical protein
MIRSAGPAGPAECNPGSVNGPALRAGLQGPPRPAKAGRGGRSATAACNTGPAQDGPVGGGHILESSPESEAGPGRGTAHWEAGP